MGCGNQCDSSSLKKMFSYLIPIIFVVFSAVLFKKNRSDHKRGYYHEGLGGPYLNTKRSGVTKITREENPSKSFCVLAGCMQRQCLVLSLLLCFIICSATNNNSSSLKS